MILSADWSIRRLQSFNFGRIEQVLKDLFNSADCRWTCKTYAKYCYRNSATERRLVQSPTLQSTICCRCPSDLRGKGIRVSPAWLSPASSEAGNELLNRALNACVQTRKCDKKVAEFGNANANHGPILVGPSYQISFSSNFIQFLSVLLL